jgi:molecular chaperone DnaK
MSVVGIDLGTTNSVVACVREGRPVAIAVDGSAIVPSTVLFLDDKVVVGREARNLELQHPARTVRSAKRKIGTGHQYPIGPRTYAPEEVSAQVLTTLREAATEHLGVEVRDAVITVPAYFDDAQRRATLRAGEQAGLNVLRLLNEPTAASLVYHQVGAESDAPEMVLVYDLGGGTFDVSVLEVFGDVREVRATTGNTQLGGDDFDEKLVQRFIDHLKLRHGVDLRRDLGAMARLRRAAEDTKIALSSEVSVRVREEFLGSHEGKAVHLDLDVTRREFEDLIEEYLRSTMELTESAVRDAGVTPEELSRICLVGGSTRIPRVRAMLRERFDTNVHDEIDPDLAVALGAALQAAVLKGEPVDRILVDVASHTLGIRTIGQHWDGMDRPDHFAPVLPRNTVLPATRTEEFYTAYDDQDQIQVEVFQGESSRCSENTSVGSFMHPLDPAPERSPVRVSFSYDLNGVIKVSISQPGSKNSKTVEMRLAAEGKRAEKSPVERKAEALLDRLEGERRETLEALLSAYRAADDDARDRAEEAILDFLIDHDEA